MDEPNNSITSHELKVFMELHQIKTVSALLEHDNLTLLKMKGFGWRLMKEVSGLRKN